jgi:3-methyladenine DNA glycosylase Tag
MRHDKGHDIGKAMRDFENIFADAAARHGGVEAFEAKLTTTRPLLIAELAVTPDDQILSQMTRHVFQSGFSWKVIEAKWPGFEAAFAGFDPSANAMMSDEAFDVLLKDTRIIRNGAKIRSVALNARMLVDLAAEHGSAARYFADWPDSDYIGLLDYLKKNGDRLGGHTGARVLRAMGKPAFVLTDNVVAALRREGVVDTEPTSKRALAAVQAAFNAWSEESGRDLTAISRTLAMSIGDIVDYSVES